MHRMTPKVMRAMLIAVTRVDDVTQTEWQIGRRILNLEPKAQKREVFAELVEELSQE